MMKLFRRNNKASSPEKTEDKVNDDNRDNKKEYNKKDIQKTVTRSIDMLTSHLSYKIHNMTNMDPDHMIEKSIEKLSSEDKRNEFENNFRNDFKIETNSVSEENVNGSSGSSQSSETQTFVSVESNDFGDRLNQFDGEFLNTNSMSIGYNTNGMNKYDNNDVDRKYRYDNKENRGNENVHPNSREYTRNRVGTHTNQYGRYGRQGSSEYQNRTDKNNGDDLDGLDVYKRHEREYKYYKEEGYNNKEYNKYNNNNNNREHRYDNKDNNKEYNKNKYNTQKKRQPRTDYSPSHNYYQGQYQYANYTQGYPGNYQYHPNTQQYSSSNEGDYRDNKEDEYLVHNQVDYTHYKDGYYQSSTDSNPDKVHADEYVPKYYQYGPPNDHEYQVYPPGYPANYPANYHGYQEHSLDEHNNFNISPKTGMDFKPENMHHYDHKMYPQVYNPQPVTKTIVKPRQRMALQILNPDTGEVVNFVKEDAKSDEALSDDKHTSDTENKDNKPEKDNKENKEEKLGEMDSDKDVRMDSQAEENEHQQDQEMGSVEMNGEMDGDNRENKRMDEYSLVMNDHGAVSMDMSASKVGSGQKPAHPGVQMPVMPITKTRLRVKNKPINPSEVIFTLSEMNPHKEVSPSMTRHSISHKRKILNVPLSSCSNSNASSSMSSDSIPEEVREDQHKYRNLPYKSARQTGTQRSDYYNNNRDSHTGDYGSKMKDFNNKYYNNTNNKENNKEYRYGYDFENRYKDREHRYDNKDNNKEYKVHRYQQYMDREEEGYNNKEYNKYNNNNGYEMKYNRKMGDRSQYGTNEYGAYGMRREYKYYKEEGYNNKEYNKYNNNGYYNVESTSMTNMNVDEYRREESEVQYINEDQRSTSIDNIVSNREEDKGEVEYKLRETEREETRRGDRDKRMDGGKMNVDSEDYNKENETKEKKEEKLEKEENKGGVFSINTMLQIAMGFKQRYNEEMGNFKLVPLNYNITRRRSRRENKWRSELSIEKEEITACKLRRVNISKEERYKRSIRTLLNKLTVENFLVVSEKIASLYKEAKEQQQVEVVVELLHEKATFELDYSDMYADLAFLLRYSFNDVLDVGNKTTSFHKTLLNKCQDSFEEISTNQNLNKDYILGNIRFMGELFLRKILSITILKRISYTLLTSKLTNNNNEDDKEEGDKDKIEQEKQDKNKKTEEEEKLGEMNSDKDVSMDSQDGGGKEEDKEEQKLKDEKDNKEDKEKEEKTKKLMFQPPANLIECFSELLTTIGYTVDQIPGGSEMLDEYIGILITLKSSNIYPTRINFKIQDLIDLRRRNWKKKLFKEKATSVSQIHRQVEQEQLRGSLSQEGKYITAGLQTTRHYTQYLLNKRQYALDSLVNGVYVKSEANENEVNAAECNMSKREGDFDHEILKLFLTCPDHETFQMEWNKYKPTDADVVNVFEHLLKSTLTNKTLELCLILSELVAYIITNLVDTEIVRGKLLNMLCDGYVVRLHNELLDNPWAMIIVSKIITMLFFYSTEESRNLLGKISIPTDFLTSKKFVINIIQGTRENGGDLGFVRRVLRRHLYSTFPQQDLLFLDEL